MRVIFLCHHNRFYAVCKLFALIKSRLFLFLMINATSEGARVALSLQGTMLGYYPVRVLPSKTAIAPVNPTFLPKV